MKIFFMVAMFVASSSFAQADDSKDSKKQLAANISHAEMHEKMSKAHQQAADCIKSGKPIEECREEFRTMCKGFADDGHCGMEPMHGRMKYRK